MPASATQRDYLKIEGLTKDFDGYKAVNNVSLTVAEGDVLGLVAGKAVTSPPHDADKDLKLGGYFVIDVPDMAAAMEWASKVPAASTGQVEIRSGFAAPGM